jgi:Holliday junction resolvasome RuvABC ATP-dependent DNA helicase subunit
MSDVAVEEVIEPVLLSLGFIDHGPRGRIITDLGIKHFEKNKLTK